MMALTGSSHVVGIQRKWLCARRSPLQPTSMWRCPVFNWLRMVLVFACVRGPFRSPRRYQISVLQGMDPNNAPTNSRPKGLGASQGEGAFATNMQHAHVQAWEHQPYITWTAVRCLMHFKYRLCIPPAHINPESDVVNSSVTDRAILELGEPSHIKTRPERNGLPLVCVCTGVVGRGQLSGCFCMVSPLCISLGMVEKQVQLFFSMLALDMC